jgi:DNA invertase Pin-like site-specific DNA recombinase
MKTVLYCRVSTADQTLEHQRTQAEGAGYRFDEVVVDHGVSGVRTALRDRPEGRRLFDMLRAGDTLVVRWMDRLGRNYGDVTDTIREFIRRGVIVRTVINGLTFDGATKDPIQQAVRDSLIAFMAAMAQSQAEVTKEAVQMLVRNRLELRMPVWRGGFGHGVSPSRLDRRIARAFAPTMLPRSHHPQPMPKLAQGRELEKPRSRKAS